MAVVLRLFGDLDQRVLSMSADAFRLLDGPTGGAGVSAATDLLRAKAAAFIDWFAAFDTMLQASSYPWATWEKPGCFGGTDRSAAPDAVFTVPRAVGDGAWVECDVTALVARWVNDPDDNFGMLIRREGGPQGAAIGYVQAYDTLMHQQRPADSDIARVPLNNTGTSGRDLGAHTDADRHAGLSVELQVQPG